MATMLKRLFWLALLCGAGFAVWSMLQRKNAGPPPASPEWPPLDPTDTTDATDASDTVDGTAAAAFADVGAEAADALAESAPAGAEAPAGGDVSATAPSSDDRWIEPVDGACPISHPVKANDNSGIFHVPGGRFYDRTGAERCYARAEDAEADGYRAAKS